MNAARTNSIGAPMTQDLIDQLRGLLAKATPGPWDVWREKCPSRYDAIAELTEQVNMTEPFSGELFLLNAGGKCPAATGCGPTSEANAELIAEAINALPGLLGTIEVQARGIEALTAALEQAAADFEDIAQLALKQIDAGEEHGARVWRIALQDIAKEADDDRQDALAALHIRDGE